MAEDRNVNGYSALLPIKIKDRSGIAVRPLRYLLSNSILKCSTAL